VVWWAMLRTVQINGPLYKKIVTGNDLALSERCPSVVRGHPRF